MLGKATVSEERPLLPYSLAGWLGYAAVQRPLAGFSYATTSEAPICGSVADEKSVAGSCLVSTEGLPYNSIRLLVARETLSEYITQFKEAPIL